MISNVMLASHVRDRVIGYGAGEEGGEISCWTYASSGSEGFHDMVIPEMKFGKWIDIHKIGMKTETENGGKN